MPLPVLVSVTPTLASDLGGMAHPTMLEVALLALTAAIASVLGGILALWHRPSTLFMSVAFGFAGGSLLATITFEMIPRALHLSTLIPTATGFGLGFAVIYAFDLYVHHGEVAGEWSEQRERVERFHSERRPLGDQVTILAGGTSLEEVVEGLTIGIGAAIEPGLASLIAAAIAVDNLSEGLSIGELVRADPRLDRSGQTRRTLTWTGLIAMSIFVPALLGWSLLQGLPLAVLSMLLAFGAGGMLYLTITQLLPTGHARHYRQSAAIATALGFLVVLVLSVLI